MTATEILRRLLDERGVEWKAFDDFEQTTQWSTHNGAFVYWARERDGKLLVETTAPTKCSASCTPEQAIEATLGCGTLTAEQVRGVLLLHLPHREYYSIEQTDGWQAIADELNATLGSCNCSNNCTNSERTTTVDETWHVGFHMWNGERVTIHVMECSKCGRTYEHVNGNYEFCPNCGRKVLD